MTSADSQVPGPRLVVISGPSGAGKSTILSRLLETSCLPLQLSVSATTRKPRPSEISGRDYLFLSGEEFLGHRQAGDFLECKEVFGRGYWYGTLREPVTSGLKEGKWVILEIDVEGAFEVLRQLPDAVTIFIHPGSLAELERRLRNRGTESDDVIRHRLQEAEREMALADQYQHCVINHDVDDAVAEIDKILTETGE